MKQLPRVAHEDDAGMHPGPPEPLQIRPSWSQMHGRLPYGAPTPCPDLQSHSCCAAQPEGQGTPAPNLTARLEAPPGEGIAPPTGCPCNPTRAALSWPLHRSCYAQLALGRKLLPSLSSSSSPHTPRLSWLLPEIYLSAGCTKRGMSLHFGGADSKGPPLPGLCYAWGLLLASPVLLCTGIPNSPVLRASGYLHKGSFVGNSRSLGLAGTADSISLQAGAELSWTAGLVGSLPLCPTGFSWKGVSHSTT